MNNNGVIFTIDDGLDEILYKVLLIILIKKNKIIAYTDKSRSINKSGYQMDNNEDYQNLIKILKIREYIKDTEIEILNTGCRILKSEYCEEFKIEFNFKLNGITELTEKGEKFMTNHSNSFKK